MAAIATNTLAAGGSNAFVPLFGSLVNSVGAGAGGQFIAVPEDSVQYFQRVWDAGTAGYCYYSKTFIDPTPLASETSPNYTGAISAHSIVDVR